MFAVIYQFEVKKNFEPQFIEAWKEFTQLIYMYEGSLGSRLHFQKDQIYIAYAQWPDKETWANAGGNLPDSAIDVRKKMREYCVKVETLMELNSIEDLLKSTVKKSLF